MQKAERLIKRYRNRKLYDTESGEYVILPQIVGLLKAGTKVRVMDHVTGKDLTGYVLATALMQEELESPRQGPEVVETLVKLLTAERKTPLQPNLASPAS